jgi:protein CpxP
MDNEEKDLSGPGAGKAVSKGWGRHAAIGGLAAVAAVSAVGFAAARSDDFGFGMGRFGMGGHVMQAHMGGGGFMEHRIGTMLDELDATPEQEDKLWDIIDDARAEIRPTFRDFRETR